MRMYRVGPFLLNALKQIIAEGKSRWSDIKQGCGIRNLIRYKEWQVLYLQNRNRLRQREHTCGCHGGVEEGEGWTANLGLVDASYYIQNGQKNKVIRHSGGLVAKSCPTLAISWTVACQAPLSMDFFRQEYWSGLPFPSPGDLPNPGIEPRSPVLQANSLPTELQGKPQIGL